MTRTESTVTLPPIPAKRYFTIGEVSDLCGVKPHVLRYWEQEFTQLKPVKRRGNRRYYQHHEVLLIRRIRSLLYEQGFTISGARSRLGDARDTPRPGCRGAPERRGDAGPAQRAGQCVDDAGRGARLGRYGFERQCGERQRHGLSMAVHCTAVYPS